MEVEKRVWSLLKILFALGLTYCALPTSGGEFTAYSTVKKFALGLMGAGVAAGWAPCSGIRGLLEG
jgi:hypothetical protein